MQEDSRIGLAMVIVVITMLLLIYHGFFRIGTFVGDKINLIRVGMTTEEVRNLLGKPDFIIEPDRHSNLLQWKYLGFWDQRGTTGSGSYESLILDFKDNILINLSYDYSLPSHLKTKPWSKRERLRIN